MHLMGMKEIFFAIVLLFFTIRLEAQLNIRIHVIDPIGNLTVSGAYVEIGNAGSITKEDGTCSIENICRLDFDDSIYVFHADYQFHPVSLYEYPIRVHGNQVEVEVRAQKQPLRNYSYQLFNAKKSKKKNDSLTMKVHYPQPDTKLDLYKEDGSWTGTLIAQADNPQLYFGRFLVDDFESSYLQLTHESKSTIHPFDLADAFYVIHIDTLNNSVDNTNSLRLIRKYCLNKKEFEMKYLELEEKQEEEVDSLYRVIWQLRGVELIEEVEEVPRVLEVELPVFPNMNARFPGGTDSMKDYLFRILRDVETKYSGTLVMEVIIARDGTPRLNCLHTFEGSEGIVQVLKDRFMVKWRPAEARGRKIEDRIVLSISFQKEK